MSDIYLSDIREPYRSEYENEIRKHREDLAKLLDDTEEPHEIKIGESFDVLQYEEV